jgi:hypothetical protein
MVPGLTIGPDHNKNLKPWLERGSSSVTALILHSSILVRPLNQTGQRRVKNLAALDRRTSDRRLEPTQFDTLFRFHCTAVGR